MKTVNVAVVGATGAVGEALREILEGRKFPVDKLAGQRALGRACSSAASR